MSPTVPPPVADPPPAQPHASLYPHEGDTTVIESTRTCDHVPLAISGTATQVLPLGYAICAMPQGNLAQQQQYPAAHPLTMHSAYGSLPQLGVQQYPAAQSAQSSMQYGMLPTAAMAVGYPASQSPQPSVMAVMTPGGAHAAADAPPTSGCSCSPGWVLFGVREHAIHHAHTHV